MTTHSCILARKILWTEEPGGSQSPWGHKESYTTERLSLSLSESRKVVARRERWGVVQWILEFQFCKMKKSWRYVL